MNNPMPKDNEVDEKAENWDYCRDLRIAVTDGKNGARATLNGYGAPAGISLYHGDYAAELKAEAAASAATVAELRAEVERLVKALDEAACELSAAGQALAEFEGFEFRQKAAIDRAYAASQKAHDANGYTEALAKVTP